MPIQKSLLGCISSGVKKPNETSIYNWFIIIAVDFIEWRRDIKPTNNKKKVAATTILSFPMLVATNNKNITAANAFRRCPLKGFKFIENVEKCIQINVIVS